MMHVRISLSLSLSPSLARHHAATTPRKVSWRKAQPNAAAHPWPWPVDMAGGPACDGSHLSLRWSSLWATKRVRGVPKWGGDIRFEPLEPSVELP